jgi:hypothetical protein
MMAIWSEHVVWCDVEKLLHSKYISSFLERRVAHKMAESVTFPNVMF